MPKILVVDDDPDFVLICRTILETEGYQVLEAASGRRALQMMRQDRPDLVLLDVMMATKTEGFEIARKIPTCPELRNMPVLLVTGWGDQIDPSQVKEYGIDAVVAKPFRIADEEPGWEAIRQP